MLTTEGVIEIDKKEEDTVSIRPMTRSDIHDVLALDREIAEGRRLLSYEDMAATDPGGPLDISFIAEINGKAIGFMINRLVYLMIPLTEVCIIQGMLIHPDYRGRGIGRKLIEKLLDYCQAEEIDRIRALVEEHNHGLRRLVEQMGFRRSNIANYDRTFESK